MKINILITSLITTLLFFSGCSTIEPDLDLEMQVSQNYLSSSKSSGVLKDEWWKKYQSEELNLLVDKALKNNPDIRMSVEKIEQAKIALASKGTEYYPSLDLKANTQGSQTQRSNNTTFREETTSATIGISYELDIWDKVGASIRSAKALTDMSVYDYEAVRLSLISSVVETYIGVLTSKEKLLVAQKHLEIMEDVLALMEKKRSLGALEDVDLSGQRATVLSQKKSITQYKNRYANASFALALLIAEPSQNFDAWQESILDLKLVEVNAGLPSELLLRRPDIAASKAVVDSSKALIQVANASRYPSFSLSAAGGVASGELLSFSNPTTILNAGLGLSYNIFDAGRLKNQVLIEESRARENLENYRKTILQAFKEVEEALSILEYAKQEEKITQELSQEYLYRMQLIEKKYNFGAVEFQIFLDAQESYISTKQQTLDTLQAKLNATLTLQKALGGGFVMKEQN